MSTDAINCIDQSTSTEEIKDSTQVFRFDSKGNSEMPQELAENIHDTLEHVRSEASRLAFCDQEDLGSIRSAAVKNISRVSDPSVTDKQIQSTMNMLARCSWLKLIECRLLDPFIAVECQFLADWGEDNVIHFLLRQQDEEWVLTAGSSIYPFSDDEIKRRAEQCRREESVGSDRALTAHENTCAQAQNSLVQL